MKPILAALAVAVGLTAAAPAFAAGDPVRGQKTFQYWCATCHAGDPREGGRLLPGTASLQVKYKGAKPAALEERTDLVPDFTKLVIRRGSEGMPFFRKTELSNQDVEDVAAYLARNLK